MARQIAPLPEQRSIRVAPVFQRSGPSSLRAATAQRCGQSNFCPREDSSKPIYSANNTQLGNIYIVEFPFAPAQDGGCIPQKLYEIKALKIFLRKSNPFGHDLACSVGSFKGQFIQQ